MRESTDEPEESDEFSFLDNPYVFFFLGPIIFLFILPFVGNQIFYNGYFSKKFIFLLSGGALFYFLLITLATLLS